jgi:hypothetical protein
MPRRRVVSGTSPARGRRGSPHSPTRCGSRRSDREPSRSPRSVRPRTWEAGPCARASPARFHAIPPPLRRRAGCPGTVERPRKGTDVRSPSSWTSEGDEGRRPAHARRAWRLPETPSAARGSSGHLRSGWGEAARRARSCRAGTVRSPAEATPLRAVSDSDELVSEAWRRQTDSLTEASKSVPEVRTSRLELVIALGGHDVGDHLPVMRNGHLFPGVANPPEDAARLGLQLPYSDRAFTPSH